MVFQASITALRGMRSSSSPPRAHPRIFVKRSNTRGAGAVLLSLLAPVYGWQVIFGGCTFSDGPGGALARSGSCSRGNAWLDLEGKGITSIAEGTFSNLPLIDYVSLSGNKLEVLPKGAFRGLPAEATVDMGSSPCALPPPSVA